MLKSKTIFTIVKILVISLSFWYIAWKLYNYDQLSEILQAFQNFTLHSFLILLSLLFLVVVNWSLEAIKWKYLIRKLELIGFIKSMKGILSGISVSIFMINRVGEFGGRIFVLKKENRMAAIPSTMLGNICQFLVTIIAGGVAVSIWIKHQGSGHSQNILVRQYAAYFIFAFAGGVFWMLFELQKIKRFLLRFSLLKKYEVLLKTIDTYSTGELFFLIGVSTLRYLVFSIQFYLALKFFLIDIGFYNALVSIALTFLVMSIIPTFGAAEIGIRGSVALFFIGMFSSHSACIVSASVFLWIINLAVPAFIGSYFVMKLKV